MSIHEAEKRDSLLTQLYDSLFDERALVPWFDEVAAVLGANAVGFSLNCFFPESAKLVWSGLEPDCVEAYSQRYYAIDPWRTANAVAEVGVAKSSDQLVERRAFARSEFGADFCRRYEVVDFQSVLLERTELQRTVLAATYTRHPKAFEDNLELFSYLAPHAKRVVHMHQRESLLRLRTRTLEEAVERASSGVLVLSRDGRVQFANPEAERCLQAGDSLGLDRDGRLCPAATLRKAIASLTRGVPLCLTVERPSGSPPYVLVFAKVGTHTSQLVGAEEGIVVHVVDPSREPPDASTLLRSAFGLTAAEVRIALAVAGGASVKAAADALGVGYATARTQILSVYSKTRTHRQSALARLVQSLGCAGDSPR